MKQINYTIEERYALLDLILINSEDRIVKANARQLIVLVATSEELSQESQELVDGFIQVQMRVLPIKQKTA